MPRAYGFDLDAVIRYLNNLTRRRIIRGYALIGGAAALFYLEPVTTADVDATFPLQDTWREYSAVWSAARDAADGHADWTLLVADTPVQLMPTGIDPLYAEAYRTSVSRRYGNLRTRVAGPEYLILMSLRAWRPPKDWPRIIGLFPIASRSRLATLLARYDDISGLLASRLETLVEWRP